VDNSINFTIKQRHSSKTSGKPVENTSELWIVNNSWATFCGKMVKQKSLTISK